MTMMMTLRTTWIGIPTRRKTEQYLGKFSPVQQAVEHLPLKNPNSNQARSAKLQCVNEMRSAPERYTSGGASLFRTFAALWKPHKELETGNTGNASRLPSIPIGLRNDVERSAKGQYSANSVGGDSWRPGSNIP